jgi:pimeloyl-ACP methyl ester carboxylesterase
MTSRGRIPVSDGVEISYSLRGPEGGRPLLFCPGLGATQLGFEADAEHFAGLGRRVIVLDPRGHGESSMPTMVEVASFTVERMADDVRRVVEHLGIGEVDFVGNSLGGVIGLALIAAAPERMRSLITYGTTYSLRLPWIVVPLQRWTYAVIGKRRLPDFVANKGTTYEHPRPVIREMFTVFRPEAAKQIRKNIYRYDYRDVAVSFSGPILIIRGSLDKDINNHLGPTLSALKRKAGFRLAEIEGAGHFTNLDKPDEVRAEIARFLADVDTGKAMESR